MCVARFRRARQRHSPWSTKPAQYQGALQRSLRVVTEELRKRVGSSFTLRELAVEYVRADDWARDTLAEREPFPGWLSSLSLVEGAAFHLYSRGAVDYEP